MTNPDLAPGRPGVRIRYGMTRTEAMRKVRLSLVVVCLLPFFGSRAALASGPPVPCRQLIATLGVGE